MKRTLLLTLSLLLSVAAFSQTNIKGRVICAGTPVEGVQVCDGVQIVTTGPDGRYEMKSDKSGEFVFITTPSGYVAHSTDGLRPGFWQYINLPVEQEEVHDFELEKQDQSTYSVLFMTDVHFVNDPRRQDLNRFKKEAYPTFKAEYDKAAKKGAVYTFNLGDLTHDIYWYEFDFDESDALTLFQDLKYISPIYSVTGNHDNDGAIIGEDVDRRAAWRYMNIWGPNAYSVNIGNEHWIFLDDISYINVAGKGKVAKGIKGDRSYDCCLIDSQIEWLKKDLAAVDAKTNVKICCHCPVLRSPNKKGYVLPKAQVALLNELGGKFDNGITIFSGHIHRMDFCDHKDYPNLYQYSFPATSGMMWETVQGWPLTSSDGTDAGVYVSTYKKGSDQPESHYQTYAFGEKYYRVYDMNEVGKVYNTDPGALKQYEKFKGSRLFYGDAKYRNCVFVNYWGYQPGHKVELWENGISLPCAKTKSEDPIRNFAYDIPILSGDIPHHSPRDKEYCDHMFEFSASDATTPLLLKIYDKDGKLLFKEKINRPIVFDPSQGSANK